MLPGESVSCTLKGMKDFNLSEASPVASWSILIFKNKNKCAVQKRSLGYRFIKLQRCHVQNDLEAAEMLFACTCVHRHPRALHRPLTWFVVWLWIHPKLSVLALSPPKRQQLWGLHPRVAEGSVLSPQLRPRGHGGRRGGRRAADHRHGPGAAGHVRERAATPHRAPPPGLRQHRCG